MNEHPNDPFDELMRRALSEEAGRIEPTDRLHEIQSEVRAQGRPANRRRPWVLTVGAAVVGTAAAVGAFAVLDDSAKRADDPPVAGSADTTTSATAQPKQATVPPTPVPSESPAPSQAATEPSSFPKVKATPEDQVKGKAVPVYWVGKAVGSRSGPGVKLYRTYERVSGGPVQEAVRMMSSDRSDDPDYYTLWNGAAVAAVSRVDGVVIVDFKVLPRQRLEPDLAAMAVQQLVYTVQGAVGDSSQKVQITEQGRSGAKLFGQLDTSQPFSRAQAANVQALVWITSPVNGQVNPSQLKVTGIAAAFEGTVEWRATNLKTRQVLSGYTTSAEGQKFSEFAFSTKLGSGEWQLEAYLTSGEDGRITDTDSKIIFVK